MGCRVRRVRCPGKTTGRLGWGVCWAANKATLGAAREPIVNQIPVRPEYPTIHSPPSLTLARRLFILRLMSGRRHTRMSGLSGRPCTHANRQECFSTAGPAPAVSSCKRRTLLLMRTNSCLVGTTALFAGAPSPHLVGQHAQRVLLHIDNHAHGGVVQHHQVVHLVATQPAQCGDGV